MAKVLDCELEESEFELLSSYYIHFQPHTVRKGKKFFIPLSY